jgi:preprotein translocase subunit SecG
MRNILPFIQIAIAIILMILILLQQRGAALGSAFGGDGGGFYATRRGAQQKILWLSIIFAVIFVALAIANLLV